MRNIAVVFGGISNESEISVITGTMAANVLKSGGDNPVPLFITRGGEMLCDKKLCDIRAFSRDMSRLPRAALVKGGVYVFGRGKPKKFLPLYAAVNCCHGGLGEGGGVSGAFALCGIPFASAGIFESAAFMDKYYTKLVLSALGIKTAEYAYVRSLSQTEEAEKLGYPLIIKPAKLGSSIGVVRADDRQALTEGLAAAFEYDDGAIVEKYFSHKREINCAACLTDGGLIVSECEEAMCGGGVFSFEDKYCGGASGKLPADIPAEVSQGVKNTVKEVYMRLNMRGIVRFDFILSDGEVYLSEVNTVPGSLSYYLLSEGFAKFRQVLSAVIGRAVLDAEAARKKRLVRTGILDNVPLNACKTRGK